MVPRAQILVVCEGVRTEPQYFREMKEFLGLDSVVHLSVVSSQGKTDPVSLVRRMKMELDKRRKLADRSAIVEPFEYAYCVMDVEAPERPGFGEAFALLRDTNKEADCRIILSNPCFEFWYILHFEKTTAPIASRRKAEERLSRHVGRYRKANARLPGQLAPKTSEAIANARAVLRESGCGADLRQHNPSTHVHLVIEQLLSFSHRPQGRN